MDEPGETHCSLTRGQPKLLATTPLARPNASWEDESRPRRMPPRRSEHSHRLLEHGSVP
jgi:hypothetical protein